MKRILILCTGNSCRSQMAEGFIRHFAGSKAEVYSAGIEAHGIHPLAVAVMAEEGLDITTHSSDKLSTYQHIEMDHVLTVCDHAREDCPYFPGAAQRFHQNFPDPAKAQGTEAEVMQAFRHTRQLLRDYCAKFVTDHLD